jgi:cytochrome c oxidase subunit 3
MASPPFAAHFESLENEEHAGTFGMWIFLSSEVLFFAGLFMLYAGYRAEYRNEFQQATHYSKLVLGTINTYILLTSSLFVAISVAAIRRNRVSLTLAMQLLTILFAGLFLVFKFVEYSEHFREGIYPGSWYRFPEAPGRGALLYFTLYFVMTGLHALHVLVGIGLFLWLLQRTARGKYTAEAHLGIDLIGLYWHFVDLVWIFLWPMFYLLR